MGRTSHPFSGFPSGKDKEEAPRRARQGRFFKQEPEGNRFKFEKIPEIPREVPSFKPPVEKQHGAEELHVRAISDSLFILDNEVARVRWYLNNFERYKELGYDSIIRLPKGVNPNDKHIEDVVLETIIRAEIGSDIEEYTRYADVLNMTWMGIAEKATLVITTLYGFEPTGDFILAPTAYGTGGGSLVKGGVVYMKLPKYRSARRRTEEEAITHEVLCHELTAPAREGIGLEDTIYAPHQWHKERLMDLLGRTILVRSGLMKRDSVVMDDFAETEACDVVDPLYYSTPETPDENYLRFEGRVKELIGKLEHSLSVPI